MKTIVTFGEIMLRLAPPNFLRFVQANSFDVIYGGGEANVAVSAANFGLPVEFVTRLPKNDIGDACLNFIRQYGVGTRHIVRGGDRLGIYFLETGAVQRGSKVIYDRAGSSLATIEPGMIDWDEVFRVPAGSTGPASPPPSRRAPLLSAWRPPRLPSRGLTVSCDLNYRSKLWKWGKKPVEVMEELVSTTDVAIGNEEDADKVFGIHAPEVDVTKGNVEADAYVYVCEHSRRASPTCRPSPSRCAAPSPPATTPGAGSCGTTARSTPRPPTTSPTLSTASAAATASWAV
jgi:2-dehydro-3-deoxygluconokinase